MEFDYRDPHDEEITMLDYFAASALTTLTGNYLDPDRAAEYVYKIAKAMIEERKKYV